LIDVRFNDSRPSEVLTEDMFAEGVARRMDRAQRNPSCRHAREASRWVSQALQPSYGPKCQMVAQYVGDGAISSFLPSAVSCGAERVLIERQRQGRQAITVSISYDRGLAKSMAALGRFSSDTIETLGKRSALTCSNPDCGALTAGPTVDELGSVNLGEAAHIFGLTPKSARYTASLTATELSDITNGIWLCRNCHKSIDNDELRFPVDLLFQWRRIHEADVLDRLGKPGERLRAKVKSDHLREFADTSYLAQQIILDKPRHWEYKLTLEILRRRAWPNCNALGSIEARNVRSSSHTHYIRRSYGLGKCEDE
jgi:hypothetical protein